MSQKKANHYDIVIAGAGFAGSLVALALQKIGLKVCLLEKGKHPRFAIGESSTPVADMILRSLSVKFNLPWLHDFSRYGSWQKSHPEIICGIKRGFSFFKHYPGKYFTTDENHTNELLVAASTSDMESDTNWLRSDVDAFLSEKVKENGIDYFDLTEITKATRKNGEWEFQITRLHINDMIHASFFIDASGSGFLAEKLLGIESSSDDFLTSSFAVFSHFNDVPHWIKILKEKNISVADYPYNPDWSALHHILDEGWMWMLRFNDERTSVGFVLNGSKKNEQDLAAEKIWKNKLEKYPELKKMLQDAVLHPQPGKIIRTGRLQRKMNNAFGEGWAALPNTVGFVDPLFSSGIAHSLSGIEKLIEIIHQHWGNDKLFYGYLKNYEQKIFTEIKIADCLIAGCYETMPYFELFNAWSMLYFAATIAHEQRRIKKEPPGYFLNADDSLITKMVYKSYDDLLKLRSKGPSAAEIKNFTRLIKERIKPFNIADLLDPNAKNMYHHTVATF